MVAETAVITLGARGLVWRRGSEGSALPAFSVQALDTTGAGDLFASGFLYGLVNHMPITKAAQLAHSAASCVIEQMGARLIERPEVA